MQLMDFFSYNCGVSLQDIPNFEGDYDDSVISRLLTSTKLTCTSPMEKPYFGVFKNEPLCYYCGDLVGLEKVSKEHYPLCEGCKNKGLSLQMKSRRSKVNTDGK